MTEKLRAAQCDVARPSTPVGWSDTDWIKHLQDQEPHPLAGLHINQGSMDAAADAYEAEYNAARDRIERATLRDEPLLRQALEALEQIARDLPWELTGLQADTIIALRERLGEKE